MLVLVSVQVLFWRACKGTCTSFCYTFWTFSEINNSINYTLRTSFRIKGTKYLQGAVLNGTNSIGMKVHKWVLVTPAVFVDFCRGVFAMRQSQPKLKVKSKVKYFFCIQRKKKLLSFSLSMAGQNTLVHSYFMCEVWSLFFLQLQVRSKTTQRHQICTIEPS